MKIEDLKKIPICEILKITPKKNEFFIHSPFRLENTPSFKINVKKNVWYDFGEGCGGTIIDLVMKLKNCDVKQARKYLIDYYTNHSFSFHQQDINFTKFDDISKIEIHKIKKLQNLALLEFLKKRKINLKYAKIYLQEIYYFWQDNSNVKKHYFSLSFKNDSGGHETRNEYFKGCIGKKDITTIKSTNNQIVSIFEGFMDFLSAITYYNKIPNNEVIILNSLSLLKNLDLSKYKKICLYLDNDSSGKTATKNLKTKYDDVLDFSTIYQDYKDFNDFLIKN